MIKKILPFVFLLFVFTSCPSKSAPVPSGDFLYFRSASNFTIFSDYAKSWDGSIEYSYDDKNWDIWDGSAELISAKADGYYNIYIRGKGNTKITGEPTASGSKKDGWAMTGADFIYCYGDIVNLINYDTKNTDNIAPYCFANLFLKNEKLASAPELGCTNLSESIYLSMFSGCKSMTKGPSTLPSSDIKESCYKNMFKETSISIPPSININAQTQLYPSCFESMFETCKNLKKAPELKSTKLANRCYSNMFRGCEKLTNLPVLPATELKDECYLDMFNGCKVLSKMPDLPAVNMKEGCYQSMFMGCENIRYMSKVNAEVLNRKCFKSMFSGCVKLEQVFRFHENSKLSEDCFQNMYTNCVKLRFSKEKTGKFKNEFKIPQLDRQVEEIELVQALENMFEGTDGGECEIEPEAGVSYWTSNAVK